jgi:oligosaccharide repeat unit polymerase
MWIAWGVCVATMVFVLLAIRRTARDSTWFHPVTWFIIAWALIFIGRPLYDLRHHDISYHQGIYIAPSYPTALVIGAVGLISFSIPFLIRPHKRKHSQKSSLKPFTSSQLTLRVSTAVALVAVLFATFLRQNGGLGVIKTFFLGRSTSTHLAYQTTSGYLYSAPLWLVGIGIYVICEARATRRRLWIGAGVLLVALSQVATIGGGDRSYFLPALLSLLVVRSLQDGRKPNLRWLVLLIPALVTFGIVLPNIYRNYDQIEGNISRATSQALQDPFTKLWQGDDTAMARNLAIEVQGVPSTLPYALGQSYVALLVRPVPRQLFPHGKPTSGEEDLDYRLITQPTGLDAGYAYSIFGEPFYNFGWMGVGGVLYLFGLAWRKAYLYVRTNRDDILAVAIYASALPVLAVMVRGGIGVDFQRLLFTVLPAFLLFRRRAARSSKPFSGARRNVDATPPTQKAIV